MKIVKLTLILMTLSGLTQAQTSEDRMQRDLRVMQQFLNELYREAYPSGNCNCDNLDEAKYLPELGILLKVPSREGFFEMRFPGDASIRFNGTDNNNLDEDQEKLIDIMKYYLVNYGNLASKLKPDEKVILTYDPQAERSDFSIAFRTKSHVEELMRIQQSWLNKERKANRNDDEEEDDDEDDEEQDEEETEDMNRHLNQITVAAYKRDIDQLMAGKLSEEDFEEKIEIKTQEYGSKNELEYKVLARVLTNSFKSDYSSPSTIYTTEPQSDDNMIDTKFPKRFVHKNLPGEYIHYRHIPDVGVSYFLDLGYRLENRNTWEGSNAGSTMSESEKSAYLKARDKKIDEIYPKLREELMQTLIEYGRTLRSLNPESYIEIVADLPTCMACNSPAKLELKIKKKTLTDYEKELISLKDAQSSIIITERGKGSDDKHLLESWSAPTPMISPSIRYYRKEE